MGINGHVVFVDEEEQQHATLDGHSNEAGEDKEPLAYYRGKYRHLACDYVKPSLAK